MPVPPPDPQGGGGGGGGSPTGAAGGDLAGTYPNPTVGLLKITDAKVAAANKDGLANVPSLRTLGTGALQALPGDTVISGGISLHDANVGLSAGGGEPLALLGPLTVHESFIVANDSEGEVFKVFDDGQPQVQALRPDASPALWLTIDAGGQDQLALPGATAALVIGSSPSQTFVDAVDGFVFFNPIQNVVWPGGTNYAGLVPVIDTSGNLRAQIAATGEGVTVWDETQEKRAEILDDGSGFSLYDSGGNARVSIPDNGPLMIADAVGFGVAGTYAALDISSLTFHGSDDVGHLIINGSSSAPSIQFNGPGGVTLLADFGLTLAGVDAVERVHLFPDGSGLALYDSGGILRLAITETDPRFTIFEANGTDPATTIGPEEVTVYDGAGSVANVLDYLGARLGGAAGPVWTVNVGIGTVGVLGATPYGQDAYLAPLNEAVTITLLTDVAGLINTTNARVNAINSYLIARGWEASS